MLLGFGADMSYVIDEHNDDKCPDCGSALSMIATRHDEDVHDFSLWTCPGCEFRDCKTEDHET